MSCKLLNSSYYIIFGIFYPAFHEPVLTEDIHKLILKLLLFCTSSGSDWVIFLNGSPHALDKTNIFLLLRLILHRLLKLNTWKESQVTLENMLEINSRFLQSTKSVTLLNFESLGPEVETAFFVNTGVNTSWLDLVGSFCWGEFQAPPHSWRT